MDGRAPTSTPAGPELVCLRWLGPSEPLSCRGYGMPQGTTEDAGGAASAGCGPRGVLPQRAATGNQEGGGRTSLPPGTPDGQLK